MGEDRRSVSRHRMHCCGTKRPDADSRAPLPLSRYGLCVPQSIPRYPLKMATVLIAAGNDVVGTKKVQWVSRFARGIVSLHGGVSSLLDATPPPVEVGRRPLGGGGVGGGGLAAEEGFSKGLASRC